MNQHVKESVCFGWDSSTVRILFSGKSEGAQKLGWEVREARQGCNIKQSSVGLSSVGGGAALWTTSMAKSSPSGEGSWGFYISTPVSYG